MRLGVSVPLLLVALAACSSDDDTGAGASGARDAGHSGSHARDASTGGSTNPTGRDASLHDASEPATERDGGQTSSDAGDETALPAAVPRDASPWGIAPSHSSSVMIGGWVNAIAESGIDWVRGFDQEHAEQSLAFARSAGCQVSGIFAFSDPGGAQTFPVNSISAFQKYVTDAVQLSFGAVKHWEVWNEPPNFSENKSPADYAKIVVAAYDAAKAADPKVQVGIAAQSVNLSFLAQALDAGAADHFDYVTVHPYETLGLVDDGWEAQFMSIVPNIRKLLADKSPAQRDVPVWFTELGEPVQGAITAEHQADTLVKAYVLGMAQGALRIHWFEALDGDSGPFGLLAGSDSAAPRRPAFTAIKTMIKQLGKEPGYFGWLLLNDRHYAFVFEAYGKPVLIAWAARGVTDQVDFGTSVHSFDLHDGSESDGNVVELTHSPIMLTAVPAELAVRAHANVDKPLPWGGEYADATSVSYSAASGAQGLHPLGSEQLTDVEGEPARDVSSGPGLSFTVDPSFVSYDTTTLRITAVVRRNGADPAGFNLEYESTEGWKGTGSWYGIPGSDQWYTQSWTISDPQFVGKWGYHFAFDSDSTQNSNYSLQSVTVSKE
jgi:hypothetical protein